MYLLVPVTIKTVGFTVVTSCFKVYGFFINVPTGVSTPGSVLFARFLFRYRLLSIHKITKPGLYKETRD